MAKAYMGSGCNPAYSSGGTPMRSMPQKPIPGSESPGQPPAMRKALAKKSQLDKGRSAPGSIR